MSASTTYECSFGGVPFLSDRAVSVCSIPIGKLFKSTDTTLPELNSLPAHQPRTDLIDELNSMAPWTQFTEWCPPSVSLGRNVSTLSRRDAATTQLYNATQVKVGEWFYPSGAGRWSVFRGLMTATQVSDILAATGGLPDTTPIWNPATFIMKSVPVGAADTAAYTLESSMYLLPPRPLNDVGAQFDGLYLVTLVDERFYWQHKPVSSTVFRITQFTTWPDVLNVLASTLGIALSYPSVSSTYAKPDTDSQLWSEYESAAILLDAVAANIGMQLVRALNGTYYLFDAANAASIARTNRQSALRGSGEVVGNIAGGDIFASGSAQTKAGDLGRARNAVVPANIAVSFPVYVTGNDPVPHYLNKRYQGQRPTGWYEDSYGGSWTVTVPIKSGGSSVSGLVGMGALMMRDTAKALYASEQSIAPTNQTELTALAMQLAQDYYTAQGTVAYDETYPGTYAWNPESIHDIIWTYSDRMQRATCRVTRCDWNRGHFSFQHAAREPSATQTNIPPGMGGPSVALAATDSLSGYITAGQPRWGVATSLTAAITTSGGSAWIAANDFLPTQNRWKALIDNEIVLMEGTSGTLQVNIAARAIDGTVRAEHAQGASLIQIVPSVNYGTNLVRAEKGQFLYPGTASSGGIQEGVLVPQLQTVQVLSDRPECINGNQLYSGRLYTWHYEAGANGNLNWDWVAGEYTWIVERNQTAPEITDPCGTDAPSIPLRSGSMHDGQLLGYSYGTGTDTNGIHKYKVAPIYGVTTPPWWNGAKYYESITTATGGTETEVQWCKLEYDTLTMHRPTSWVRFYAPVDGVYHVTANLIGTFSNITATVDRPIITESRIRGPAPQNIGGNIVVSSDTKTYDYRATSYGTSQALELTMQRGDAVLVTLTSTYATVSLADKLSSFTVTLLNRGLDIFQAATSSANCVTTDKDCALVCCHGCLCLALTFSVSGIETCCSELDGKVVYLTFDPKSCTFYGQVWTQCGVTYIHATNTQLELSGACSATVPISGTVADCYLTYSNSDGDGDGDGCCGGTETVCCDGISIPNVLCGTISGLTDDWAPNCTCFNGKSFRLVREGESWAGSIMECPISNLGPPRRICFWLYCGTGGYADDIVPNGCDNTTSWTLITTLANASGGPSFACAPADTSCTPFRLTFRQNNSTGFYLRTDGCGSYSSPSATIVITPADDNGNCAANGAGSCTIDLPGGVGPGSAPSGGDDVSGGAALTPIISATGTQVDPALCDGSGGCLHTCVCVDLEIAASGTDCDVLDGQHVYLTLNQTTCVFTGTVVVNGETYTVSADDNALTITGPNCSLGQPVPATALADCGNLYQLGQFTAVMSPASATDCGLCTYAPVGCDKFCNGCCVPEYLSVTISGIADGSCADCENMNGTWCIRGGGSLAPPYWCIWQSEGVAGQTLPDSGCGSAIPPGITLNFFDGEWFVTVAIGANGANVGYLIGDFNCSGLNTFIIPDADLGGYCHGPVTVVIDTSCTGVSCANDDPSDCCSATFPDTLCMTATNTTGDFTCYSAESPIVFTRIGSGTWAANNPCCSTPGTTLQLMQTSTDPTCSTWSLVGILPPAGPWTATASSCNPLALTFTIPDGTTICGAYSGGMTATFAPCGTNSDNSWFCIKQEACSQLSWFCDTNVCTNNGGTVSTSYFCQQLDAAIWGSSPSVGDFKCVGVGGGVFVIQTIVAGPYVSSTSCDAACPPSSGGGGGGQTICCPTITVPNALTGYVTSGSGILDIAGPGAGPIELTYDTVSGYWSGTSRACSSQALIQLRCNPLSGTWELRVYNTNPACVVVDWTASTATATSCDGAAGFSLWFTLTANKTCDCDVSIGAGTFTINITY